MIIRTINITSAKEYSHTLKYLILLTHLYRFYFSDTTFQRNITANTIKFLQRWKNNIWGRKRFHLSIPLSNTLAFISRHAHVCWLFIPGVHWYATQNNRNNFTNDQTTRAITDNSSRVSLRLESTCAKQISGNLTRLRQHTWIPLLGYWGFIHLTSITHKTLFICT